VIQFWGWSGRNPGFCITLKFLLTLLSVGHKGNRCQTEHGAATWRTTWPWQRSAGSDCFLVWYVVWQQTHVCKNFEYIATVDVYKVWLYFDIVSCNMHVWLQASRVTWQRICTRRWEVKTGSGTLTSPQLSLPVCTFLFEFFLFRVYLFIVWSCVSESVLNVNAMCVYTHLVFQK